MATATKVITLTLSVDEALTLADYYDMVTDSADSTDEEWEIYNALQGLDL